MPRLTKGRFMRLVDLLNLIGQADDIRVIVGQLRGDTRVDGEDPLLPAVHLDALNRIADAIEAAARTRALPAPDPACPLYGAVPSSLKPHKLLADPVDYDSRRLRFGQAALESESPDLADVRRRRRRSPR